jgi:hypothetical protein
VILLVLNSFQDIEEWGIHATSYIHCHFEDKKKPNTPKKLLKLSQVNIARMNTPCLLSSSYEEDLYQRALDKSITCQLLSTQLLDHSFLQAQRKMINHKLINHKPYLTAGKGAR